MGWYIFGIVAAIIVFILCRELMCWYYKINRLIELMEQQNALLRGKSNSASIANTSGENRVILGNKLQRYILTFLAAAVARPVLPLSALRRSTLSAFPRARAGCPLFPLSLAGTSSLLLYFSGVKR